MTLLLAEPKARQLKGDSELQLCRGEMRIHLQAHVAPKTQPREFQSNVQDEGDTGGSQELLCKA